MALKDYLRPIDHSVYSKVGKIAKSIRKITTLLLGQGIAWKNSYPGKMMRKIPILPGGGWVPERFERCVISRFSDKKTKI